MQALPTADLEHILAHTGELWEPLRDQNLFITGGTGFFGRWLLESFAFINRRLDLGAQMTVLTRKRTAFIAKAPAKLVADPALQLVSGDVRTLDRKRLLRKLGRGHSGEFAFFIHAATESGSRLSWDDPLATFDTIVTGTRAALEFAVSSGTRRFLFTSSGAVYGRQPPEMDSLGEDYTGGPDCTQALAGYSEGKRAAEVLCACFHQQGGLETVIARCIAFIGPLLPLDAHFAAGSFINDVLLGRPVRVQGDGSPVRSYLYAAELAIWLWKLLFRGEAGCAYNVGSDIPVDVEALARLVAAQGRPACQVEIALPRDPAIPAARYVPNVSRIKSRLQVTELIPLEEAIARTLAYYRGAVEGEKMGSRRTARHVV